MGRGPAGRAPPALPDAGPRRRGDHAEGPHAPHAAVGRVRAADRPHQRRPGASAGCRRRWRQRSDCTDVARRSLPAPHEPDGQADGLRAGRRRSDACGRRWPRRAPGGSATTTTPRSRRRGGTVPAARGCCTHARLGRRDRAVSRRCGSRSCWRAALPSRRWSRALLAAHPYEEPAYDVVELGDPGLGATGTGRIGSVEPTTLRDFADAVAAALPDDRPRRAGRGRSRPRRTTGGAVRGSGRLPARHRAPAPTPTSTSPATCATTGPASSSRRTGPALVDVAHWAAEWTWLPVVSARVAEALGDTVGTRVSTTNTDPWQFRI